MTNGLTTMLMLSVSIACLDSAPACRLTSRLGLPGPVTIRRVTLDYTASHPTHCHQHPKRRGPHVRSTCTVHTRSARLQCTVTETQTVAQNTIQTSMRPPLEFLIKIGENKET